MFVWLQTTPSPTVYNDSQQALKTIHVNNPCNWHWGIPSWCSGKESACQCRRCERHSSISGSRRSPGEGNGNHSSILAWKIPWTEEPGRLQSGIAESWTDFATELSHRKGLRDIWESLFWKTISTLYYLFTGVMEIRIQIKHCSDPI